MIRDEIADQLVYATVKITCTCNRTLSTGTGFFMQKSLPSGNNITAIVTNKHVVQGYEIAEIPLVSKNMDGSPNDKEHINISISDLQKRCFYHPDSSIDICLVFINDLIDGAAKLGKPLYFRCIGEEMILSRESVNSLTAIEDVLMIGYPSGIIDDTNNKPIVRKGITATSIKLDYKGLPDFVIDIACFPGSSGSPVFLRKEGLAQESGPKGMTIDVVPRYSLLGIIHSMISRKEDGELKVKEIPTTEKQVIEFDMPLNLGMVTKSSKIMELFEMVEKNL